MGRTVGATSLKLYIKESVLFAALLDMHKENKTQTRQSLALVGGMYHSPPSIVSAAYTKYTPLLSTVQVYQLHKLHKLPLSYMFKCVHSAYTSYTPSISLVQVSPLHILHTLPKEKFNLDQ